MFVTAIGFDRAKSVFRSTDRPHHGDHVEMTRTTLEGFGRQVTKTDDVAIKATLDCMTVSRILSPYDAAGDCQSASGQPVPVCGVLNVAFSSVDSTHVVP